MRPAARVKAAINVLTEIHTRHRPASTALADWGKANRYAGSGDRAAIGNLVFDALRRRAGAEHLMGAKTARAQTLGALRLVGGLDVDAIAALCDGAPHAPPVLSAEERARLRDTPSEARTPPDVQAELPAWVWPLFQETFGDDAIRQGRAMAERAPVDLRTNTLSSERAKLAATLAKYEATPTTLTTTGLRIRAPEGTGRHPNVEADLTHGQGWFEVQDEGSQIAAALVGAKPGHTVLDLCAGAGGKTLAIAAAMKNQGRIVATDADQMRLRPIVERLKRAGATCVDVVAADARAGLAGRTFDRVLVDAPCTGSGTWRRKPDAKWRTRPAALDKRMGEQRDVLDQAAAHVRPHGRLVYVTCSVFPAENTAQIAAFQMRHPGFDVVATARAWADASAGTLTAAVPASADGRTDTLLLTPASHGTDGFFVAVLERTR
jgi:16S rRNA (cytosine967-C5)-methyltransferase